MVSGRALWDAFCHPGCAWEGGPEGGLWAFCWAARVFFEDLGLKSFRKNQGLGLQGVGSMRTIITV